MKKVGGQKRLQFHLTADDAEALLGDAEVGGDVAQGDALHDVRLLVQQMLVAVAGRARLKAACEISYIRRMAIEYIWKVNLCTDRLPAISRSMV